MIWWCNRGALRRASLSRVRIVYGTGESRVRFQQFPSRVHHGCLATTRLWLIACLCHTLASTSDTMPWHTTVAERQLPLESSDSTSSAARTTLLILSASTGICRPSGPSCRHSSSGRVTQLTFFRRMPTTTRPNPRLPSPCHHDLDSRGVLEWRFQSRFGTWDC